MDKDALIHELGALIVGNPKVAAASWDRYALVVRIDSGQSKLHGFAHTNGNYQPVTPTGFALHDTLAKLRAATHIEGKDPWGACVIRIDRSSGKIRVEFEYDAPERWTVTPQNAQQIAERALPV
ncbi:MAG TPA: hypothetical protein VIT67_16745 [Povalibacter sp.]